MAKDFQFEGKKMLVKAGERGTMKIPSPDVAFLDKKYFIVSGIALAKISVLVGCGETNIDLTDFPSTATFRGLVMSSSTDHIIEVPIPTNNLAISIDNSSGGTDVNVHFYGGSA